MAKSIYLYATEPRTGKTVVTLGIMQVLLHDIRKVAFFKPIIRETKTSRDRHIELILSQFFLGMQYKDAYCYTFEEASKLIQQGKQAELMENIFVKYKKLEENYDFVLCLGTDFEGDSSALEFDINSDIAINIGAPLLQICSAKGKTCQDAFGSALLNLETMEEKGVDVLGFILNRVSNCQIDDFYLQAKSDEKLKDKIVYILPEEDSLAHPTVADVNKWMNGEILYGKDRMESSVTGYEIAAMQPANFLNYIKEGSLVITPGDRTDIILASLTSRLSNNFPNIAGILLTGGIPIAPNITKILDGWIEFPFPVLFVKNSTFETSSIVNDLYGKIEPTNKRKIASAIGTFERSINPKDLRRRLETNKSGKVTPQMFEYAIQEQAIKNKQHIVLPEGTEPRILQAADLLLRRGIADITLLGNITEVQSKISHLGLKLPNVNIIQPDKCPQFNDYVETYFKLREKKGITKEIAHDTMADSSYFGTMMVYKGHADGMVSGAINTTAHTIRPALQFIKTKPNVSVVSSVFFMCLKDRVLAFADCAVNPNPTSNELAEIAITTAETARIFGLEPRIAMLSYSTGASGKGEDVDKVVEATRIAKEKAPELLLEGPLQYDAAIDVEVAKTKMPNSAVAGKATIFIFPDLNTGNNTYKAVQRAANAIAIGPILQGLNKPVNDLSRGCSVADIVNTVTITAIQAQAEKK